MKDTTFPFLVLRAAFFHGKRKVCFKLHLPCLSGRQSGQASEIPFAAARCRDVPVRLLSDVMTWQRQHTTGHTGTCQSPVRAYSFTMLLQGYGPGWIKEL
jgi:hypothetical protein